MQIYNEKDQTGQREIQNVKFEDKRIVKKCIGSKSSAQWDEQFKEKPNGI